MRPSELTSALTALVNARRPAFVWGPPGVCKSSVVRQLAKNQGRPLVDIRAVLLDPVDLRGLPRVTKDGRASWCPPGFLPHDKDSNAIVFLDELAQAPAMVQSACLQLTLDRRLGEYELPEGCAIVAASNRQEDRAGAHRMITPLLNRFVHLDVEVSNDDWHAWAIGACIDSRVTAFLRFKPEALFAFDPKAADTRAFPTPRSWHFVSDCIKSLPPDVRLYDIAAGCVGPGAAGEFKAFVDIYQSLPDITRLVASPSTHPLPQNAPSVTYALCGALVDHLRANPKAANAIATIAARLPAEYGVLAMRDALSVAPSILSTPAGAAWIKANRDVINAGGAQ